MTWDYEKLDEEGKKITVSNYTIDSKKEYTGQFVFNVKAWFDEHPDEWVARGWTKHIHYETKEIKQKWPHNAQTQILVKGINRVDEHTIEDVYYVLDKSEEMMRLQELLGVVDAWGNRIVTFGPDE
ncbi:MAG: hypothetical protein IKS31_04850 [Clostridia bacterium]|nr:hypothetical protein [Clostridia bacterium]